MTRPSSRSQPKPAWLRQPLAAGGRAAALGRELELAGLATVCQEARCPNQGQCHAQGVATFLVMGRQCTRACAFCAVKKGRPEPLDPEEPARVARQIARLGLKHAVITSVTRDDLADGGAAHLAAVVDALRREAPQVVLELLIPDLAGSREALARVTASRPQVLAHNLETVPRLYGQARAGADYRRSLKVLAMAKELAPGLLTKSGIMLGLGEENAEVEAVLADLREAGCDMLTLGQYLAPSPRHLPVVRWVEPAEFARLGELAKGMGFKSVAVGPLVRSSYLAERGYREALDGNHALAGGPGSGGAHT